MLAHHCAGVPFKVNASSLDHKPCHCSVTHNHLLVAFCPSVKLTFTNVLAQFYSDPLHDAVND